MDEIKAGRIRRTEIKPGEPLLPGPHERIVKVESFWRQRQLRVWATVETELTEAEKGVK